jgi:hypothetical protein
VYVLKRWMRTAFEGIGEALEAGDCMYQEPGISHRVLDYSADLEVLEITIPAEFETATMEPRSQKGGAEGRRPWSTALGDGPAHCRHRATPARCNAIRKRSTRRPDLGGAPALEPDLGLSTETAAYDQKHRLGRYFGVSVRRTSGIAARRIRKLFATEIDTSVPGRLVMQGSPPVGFVRADASWKSQNPAVPGSFCVRRLVLCRAGPGVRSCQAAARVRSCQAAAWVRLRQAAARGSFVPGRRSGSFVPGRRLGFVRVRAAAWVRSCQAVARVRSCQAVARVRSDLRTPPAAIAPRPDARWEFYPICGDVTITI